MTTQNIAHNKKPKGDTGMIKATIKHNGFRIEGHANYAPSGYDIVCAGVSALVDGVITACNDFELWIEVKQEDGLVDVQFKEMYWNSPSLYIYSVLRSGLSHIAEQYPQHLEVLHET